MVLPPQLRFINQEMNKRELTRLVSQCYYLLGNSETVRLLDALKELGFRYATLSGLSFSTADLKVPTEKKRQFLAKTEKEQLLEALKNHDWIQKEAADSLGISVRTAETHRMNLMRKLNLLNVSGGNITDKGLRQIEALSSL